MRGSEPQLGHGRTPCQFLHFGVRTNKLPQLSVLTNTTVVRSLRSGEAAFGPSVRRAIGVEEGVLLLQTEPWNVLLGLLHDLGSVVAVVGPVGGAIVVVRLGKNEDVGTATEGVLEDGSRSEVNVGIVTRSLVGGRAIKVPDAEISDVFDLLRDGLHMEGRD